MCTCVYIQHTYVHIYMYICICLWPVFFFCTFIYVHVCCMYTHVHMYICWLIWPNTRKQERARETRQTQTYATHTRARARTHTHTYTHTQTNTHTYIQIHIYLEINWTIWLDSHTQTRERARSSTRTLARISTTSEIAWNCGQPSAERAAPASAIGLSSSPPNTPMIPSPSWDCVHEAALLAEWGRLVWYVRSFSPDVILNVQSQQGYSVKGILQEPIDKAMGWLRLGSPWKL